MNVETQSRSYFSLIIYLLAIASLRNCNVEVRMAPGNMVQVTRLPNSGDVTDS